MKQKEAYKNALTEEQKLTLKYGLIRLKELERAEKTKLKSRLQESGKPKRPNNAFVLFFAEEAKKSKTNLKETKNKYDKLSDSQKAVYKQKATVLREEYR